MALSDIRAAIQAALVAVDANARVHNYLRFTVEPEQFLAFYKDAVAARVNAFEHTRVACQEAIAADGVQVDRVHTWKINVYRSHDDATATENTFEDFLETVLAGLRFNVTLSGSVFRSRTASIDRIDFEMKGDVGVHIGELSLEVEERLTVAGLAAPAPPADPSNPHDRLMALIDATLVAQGLTVTRGRNFPLPRAAKAGLLVAMPEQPLKATNDAALERWPVLVRASLDAQDTPGASGLATGHNGKRELGGWLDAVRNAYHLKTGTDFATFTGLVSTRAEMSARDALTVRDATPWAVRVEGELTVTADVWRAVV